MPNFHPQPVYYPDLAGSKAYRIPSMITTLKGTVIAGIDARIADQTDNPNQIDATIRRSEDHGKTWGEVQKLVAFAGEGLDGAAAIDTSLLQDQTTGNIFMIYCHTPGGIGLWNSNAGRGFDTDGRRLLYDREGSEYALETDGTVTNGEGLITDYKVDPQGNVFKQDRPQGNIYFKQGTDADESLLEARTSFLQIIQSEDDGVTWSTPRDLNPMVKEEWMRFIGSGPGCGIQLMHGKHAGRLLFPIYFSNEAYQMSCACIYSDDHGVTWRRGESPNDGRIVDGETLSARTLAENRHNLTETQVIELPSGEVRAYMRNHAGVQRTAIASSYDGGQTWGEVTFDMALTDPTCQSSVILYPDQGDGKVRVLFSNPSDEKTRVKGTVRLSEDGGITWPYSRVVEEGFFGYSCLTALANGEVGILYERVFDYSDWNNMDIPFGSFTLEWLKAGDEAEPVEACTSFPTYRNRMGLFEVLPPVRDAVVFAGDSLTQRNQWSEFFADVKVVNRGIDSDRVAALAQRLDAILALEPRKLFLMIGINDVYDGKEDAVILNHYEALLVRIKQALPATRLYVQSLLPVNNGVYHHQLQNEAIRRFNSRLAELCGRLDVPFLDLYGHFLNGNEMDAEYTDDGCHLTGRGYSRWVQLIETYVKE
ncbi:exo-alpha-sialidase [Paenibacillus aurantiacus]|uniref:exo-alpha-sialidase n=1 Tax=Paenibacillus aurantiacus TaxID=1936118 RepID=A0ABV5KSD5_9BACL